MIPSLLEEVRIILYLILYGIFLLSTYDILLKIINTMKRWMQIVLQLVYAFIIVILTIKFSYNLYDGYIPIVFPFFFIIGAVIYYYLLRKSMIVGVNQVISIFKWLLKPLKKGVKFLFWPKDTMNTLGYPFKKMKETVITFKNQIKKNKTNQELEE